MSYPPDSLDEGITDATTAAPNVHSGHHATANAAVNTIVAELGTAPAGTRQTVQARLEAIEATLDLLNTAALLAVANAPVTTYGLGFLSLADEATARAYIGSASPVRPVVDAGADQTTTVGTTVHLSGTDISHTGSVTYAWTIVDKPGGSSATISSSTSLTGATIVPDVVGSYTFRLTATDSVYVGTDDVAVITNAVPPRTALKADAASEGTIRVYRRRLASSAPTDGSWDDAAIVIQSPFSYAAAQANKARVPAQYQLMYADFNSSRGYDSSSTPPGMVRYADMQEAWFMHFNNGTTSSYRGVWPYNQHWQTRTDNTDFQAAWLAAAMNLLDTYGWDGLYVDNTFLKWPAGYTIAAAAVAGDDGVLGHTFTYANHASYWPIGWRTQADVLARTVEFITAVYSTITSAGYLFIPNIGDNRTLRTISPDYNPIRDDLGSLIDGMMDEFFCFTGTQTTPNDGIGTQLPTSGVHDVLAQWSEPDVLNDSNQVFLGCFETDSTANVAKAKRAAVQYLLTNHGRSYFSFGDDNGVGPLVSVYTGPCGNALEDYQTVSQSGKVGCYTRRFQHAIAVYNTGRTNPSAGVLTGDTFTNVALGGTYYLSGSPVTTISSVAPGDAYLLYDS